MRFFRSATIVLVLAACGRHQPATVVKGAAPGGCSTELAIQPAHPFLAEFERRITVTCGGGAVTLTLQRDPGDLGRIELVGLERGDLAVTDAFQSAVVRLGKTALVDAGLQEGKLDRYETPCARRQLFQRRRGEFLGAFDYCDHRWVFLAPSEERHFSSSAQRW